MLRLMHALLRLGHALSSSLLLLAACGGSSDSGSGADDGRPLTAAECSAHPTCDATTSCAAGTTCAVIADCSAPICIAEAEACAKRCGSRDCLIAESYPVQIGCAPRETGSGGASSGGAAGASTGGSGAGGAGGAMTGGAGGSRTCADVERDLEAALADVRSCASSSECGQVLEGTSCGCTRNLVARNDADASRVFALLAERVNGETCAGLSSTCDCPEVSGFTCEQGVCGWNYVVPE